MNLRTEIWSWETGPLDLETLRQAFLTGALTPDALVDAVYGRIDTGGQNNVWTALVPRQEALARARELMKTASPETHPLYGVPFGVKDGFDLAGLPTSHGVRAWSRMAEETSPIVQRMIDAGGIPVGKQNMDQLGIGLNGTRTDFGIPACAFDSRYISGGSSSGGAVSVAAGLVSFAVAGDAAGSGRVPAALNNIVGYKPTPGLFPRSGASKAGMVGTDNFLTSTVADAVTLSNLWFQYECTDPFSKPEAAGFALSRDPAPDSFRFAIPAAESLVFDDDTEAERIFAESVERLVALGGEPVPIDATPYLTAAKLLYEDAYIAQRYANHGDRFEEEPSALHPATAEILSWGRKYSGADVFEVQYRMAGYVQQARALFRQVDLLVTPTTPTTYTIEELAGDNIRLNAMLGTYTNFVNLLDLPAISVPAGFRSDGIPLGSMLIGPRLGDDLICRIGSALHAALDIAPGLAGRTLS